MEIKRKYQIKKTSFPIDGIYNYNASVLISIDGGKNYYYCGIGKFCETYDKAKQFCDEYENSHK